MRVNRALSTYGDRMRMFPSDELKASYGALCGPSISECSLFCVNKWNFQELSYKSPMCFTLSSQFSALTDSIYTHEINFKRFQCICLEISLILDK